MAGKKDFKIKKKDIIDKTVIKKMADDATKDILEHSHRVISLFYADYHPRVYKRTGAMYRIYHYPKIKETDDSCTLSFVFSDQYLYPLHEDESDSVFTNAFEEGWHGPGVLHSPEKMIPSPWSMICDYVLSNYDNVQIL